MEKQAASLKTKKINKKPKPKPKACCKSKKKKIHENLNPTALNQRQ